MEEVEEVEVAVVICFCKLTLMFLAQANDKETPKEMRRVPYQTGVHGKLNFRHSSYEMSRCTYIQLPMACIHPGLHSL